MRAVKLSLLSLRPTPGAVVLSAEKQRRRVATVPLTIPNEDEGGPGLSLLETGDIDTMAGRGLGNSSRP